MLLRSGTRRLGAMAKRTATAQPREDAPRVVMAKGTEPKRKKRRTKERAVSASNLQALRDKGVRIAEILRELYPEARCPLEHMTPYQLLVAVVLSAQTTDKMVNQCTPALFERAPDPESMAKLGVSSILEILEYVRKVGLAPTKARNISHLSQKLLEVHDGQVPSTFEALEALPGVGHKTASVVMIHAFGASAFPVDTHVHRLATRWGLTSGKNVIHTEEDLKNIFPEADWNDVSLRIIFFGREHCPAKGHDMKACPICSWAAEKDGGSPEMSKSPKKEEKSSS